MKQTDDQSMPAVPQSGAASARHNHRQMYSSDEIARHNIAETVRHLINQKIPASAIRTALRQQCAVLGDVGENETSNRKEA